MKSGLRIIPPSQIKSIHAGLLATAYCFQELGELKDAQSWARQLRLFTSRKRLFGKLGPDSEIEAIELQAKLARLTGKWHQAKDGYAKCFRYYLKSEQSLKAATVSIPLCLSQLAIGRLTEAISTIETCRAIAMKLGEGLVTDILGMLILQVEVGRTLTFKLVADLQTCLDEALSDAQGLHSEDL